MQPNDDTLFRTDRVSETTGPRGSVVVVGLPRSGSSFLSHVLSQIPDWYVFDDLYLFRAARENRAMGALDDKKLRNLLTFLGWQIRARARFGLYAIPKVDEGEIDPMNEALFQCFSHQGATWLDLQEEWLIRLAARNGCRNWGYKMPGAFRHLKLLLEAYPNMKVIFLMRSPEEVLASYKHMPKTSQDGDPAQYHPVVYAFYWRAAARAWLRAKSHYPDRVKLIRFHDLVKDPSTAAQNMAAFLDASAPEVVTVPKNANTSFSDPDKKRPGLNRLEAQILTRVTGNVAADLGFSQTSIPPERGLADYVDLIGRTWRFFRFQVGKFVRARKS